MDALCSDIDYNTVTDPPWGKYGRVAVLSVVASFSKLVFNVFNTTNIEDRDREALYNHVTKREPGRPLITVANHRSTVDDPMLFCSILPMSVFLDEADKKWMRWTLCAKEICYRNEFLAQFFRNGKALPVVRGIGMEQPTMDKAGHLLGAGDWVHIFPEGRISFSGEMTPAFKKGVAKLVCDTAKANPKDPVVLPFYHTGTEAVMPKGGSFPHPGSTVNVNFGEPIEMADLCAKCRKAGDRSKQLKKVYEEITDRIRGRMEDLERAHHAKFGTVGKEKHGSGGVFPPEQRGG